MSAATTALLMGMSRAQLVMQAQDMQLEIEELRAKLAEAEKSREGLITKLSSNHRMKEIGRAIERAAVEKAKAAGLTDADLLAIGLKP